MYSTSECISLCGALWSLAARTTALAMECGKCSSRQAAKVNISSASWPLKGMISSNSGSALVKVPVLSNTIISAAAICSKNLPPLTVTPRLEASPIADKTDNGIDNFKAQEKSTIMKDKALVTLRVNKKVNAAPKKENGTNRSAMR